MAENKKEGRLRRALGRTAPALAEALGGPLAGRVAGMVARAVLGREEGDADLVAEAVETASPEGLERLALAALAFEEAKLAALVEEECIAARDRADARARERALGDRLPGVLALSVVLGFFAVLGLMLLHRVPEGAETEFSIMLGALATMAAAVMNYYFGSSASSREKTQMLGRGGLPGAPGGR